MPAARRFYVIVNARSGTAADAADHPETLEEAFAAAGLDATIDADFDMPLDERIARAVASPCDAVVAAGGDGTVTAVAAALHKAETDKVMAILPLGTANLLARDLGIPLSLPEAIAQLALMEPHAIDVGEVNGLPFLHKVVVGTIPELAAGREYIRDKPGLGATIGYMRYVVRRLVRAKRFAVEITTDGGERRIERVQALAVGTNTYDEGLGRFFARPNLDQGFLSLYILKHLTPADAVKLAALMLLGRWRDYEALSIRTVHRVTLRDKKKTRQVMFDGEIMTLDMPMHFSIRPRALPILAPVATEADKAQDVLVAETAQGL